MMSSQQESEAFFRLELIIIPSDIPLVKAVHFITEDLMGGLGMAAQIQMAL
jgi:hypothetical protein